MEAASLNRPYISVVVAARNDNHGGHMVGRLQAFLDSWMVQAQRYRVPSEIVVVEWNPPVDRGKLQDEFRWSDETGACPVRFVEVPREVHAAIPNAAAIPLHQMIAKNAGVRRARGQFVLCTNLDIIFSAELMQFLAARSLDPHAMYRMDRYDVDHRIPSQAGVDELLAFCAANIRRVCGREGTFETNGDNIRPVEPEDIVAAGSGIRLGRGWFNLERYRNMSMTRYVDATGEVVFERRPAGASGIVFHVEPGPSARDGSVELDLMDAGGALLDSALVDGRCKLLLEIPDAARSGRFCLRVRKGGVALVEDIRTLDLRVFAIEWWKGDSTAGTRPLQVIERIPGAGACGVHSPYAAWMLNPRYLHTNACGDFTLLSREAWFALRGYPEFPYWPTHLDALLCYSAHHAGIPEIILSDPKRVFHIEHQAVWTPESEAEREARAAARGVSMVGYGRLLDFFALMRRFNAPLIFTGENWGLAGMELPETSP
jgi:hypothetical protein